MGRMDDELAREFPEATARYEAAMDRLRFPDDHVRPENLQVEDAMTEEDVIKMVTHIQCQACRHVQELDVLVIDLDYIEEFDDFNDMSMLCCAEPCPVGLIVSDVPLFPPDDATHETNVDRWHHGNKRYEYELNDDFADELGLE